MILADSNIFIYAASGQHSALLQFIQAHTPAASSITKIEVLGFHNFVAGDREKLEKLFTLCRIIRVNDAITEKAIQLRQNRKFGLADAIVAATALVTSRTLATRNIRDFSWIPNLKLLDPLAHP